MLVHGLQSWPITKPTWGEFCRGTSRIVNLCLYQLYDVNSEVVGLYLQTTKTNVHSAAVGPTLIYHNISQYITYVLY